MGAITLPLKAHSLAKSLVVIRSAKGKLKNMTQTPILDRITVEVGKCGGKPCIRGMRITVRRVLELLATHRDPAELFREYAFLEEEDVRQALTFAAASVDNELLELNQVA